MKNMRGDNPMRTKVVVVWAACVFAVLGAAGASAPAENAVAAERALKPWGTNTEATDAAKSKVQEITQRIQNYTEVQGGTMDGRNCRTPMGCGMSREGAFYQTWESNRSARMENVGETD